MQKRLGIVPYVLARPLIRDLPGPGSPFVIEYCDALSAAARMRDRLLDVGFLSPIDYALNSIDYSIIPGIGVSSRTANRSVLLVFRQGLRNVTSVAVASASTAEIVTARIVLAENYEVNPALVPVPSEPLPSIEAMLGKADAALISGDEALVRGEAIESALDLTEEWKTVSDLPFVHGFWVVRPNMLTDDELHRLVESRDRGIGQLEVLAAEYAAEARIDASSVAKLLTSLSFDLDEEDISSVRELFRFAFYHGFLHEVPSIRFLTP